MNGMVARVLLSARIIIPLSLADCFEQCSFNPSSTEAGFEARKTHTLMALHAAGSFCCRPQGVRQRNEDCTQENRRKTLSAHVGSRQRMTDVTGVIQ